MTFLFQMATKGKSKAKEFEKAVARVLSEIEGVEVESCTIGQLQIMWGVILLLQHSILP